MPPMIAMERILPASVFIVALYEVDAALKRTGRLRAALVACNAQMRSAITQGWWRSAPVWSEARMGTDLSLSPSSPSEDQAQRRQTERVSMHLGVTGH